MDITDRTEHQTTIIALSGRWICDDDRRKNTRGRLQQLVETGRLDVVLDLSGVTFADSTVLGEMASMSLTLRRRGGRLTLLNPTRRMTQLLYVSRLATVIEVRRSDDPPAAAWNPPSGELIRGVDSQTQVPIWSTAS